MKACANSNCRSYGRVVYTSATRCLFCRCDLKPTWMRSGITTAQKVRPEGSKKTAWLPPALCPVSWPRPRRHALYAVIQLNQRSPAEKDAILVSLLHPADQAGIRARLQPFRNRILVQKKVHCRIFRGRALSRRTLKFDPRKEDPAKTPPNYRCAWFSLPLLRSHHNRGCAPLPGDGFADPPTWLS